MKRQIYRAWLPESGEMIYSDSYDGDDYIFVLGKDGIHIEYFDRDHVKEGGGEILDDPKWEKIPAVIMEITPKIDTFGRPVYEGDIIHQISRFDWHSKVDSKYFIEFGYQDLGGASYQQTIGWNATDLRKLKNSDRDFTKGINDLCFDHPGISAMVIGNIYQHPELCK